MLTHTIRRSCTTCIRFVIAFAILDGTPPARIMASTPVRPPDDPTVIVRIDSIVVGGENKAAADIAQAKVIRARDATEEAAQFDMGLSAGDILETYGDTQVSLVYADANDPVAVNTEVIVYPNSRVVIGSLWVSLGSAFYRIRGYFSSGTNAGTGGTPSTEFKISFTNNEFDLSVLDGTVNVLAFDMIINGDPDLKDFDFKNNCEKIHKFVFRAPATMPWLELKPSTVELKAGQKVKVVPTVALRSNEQTPEPGTYKDSIKPVCRDCTRDLSCRRRVLLDRLVNERYLEVTVRKTLAGRVEPVTKKAELKRKRGDTAEPKSRMLSDEEVKDRVNETSDRIIKASSSKVGVNVLPNFSTADERNYAFKKARLNSVLNSDEAGRQTMGDVYLDWGKGVRAVQAYEKVDKSDSSIRNTSTFRANYGEALRISGKLTEATDQLGLALSIEKDASSVRTLTAEGNLYLDKARRALKQNEDPESIDALIKRAQDSYIKAGKTVRETGTKPQKAVLLTNLGDLYSVKGQLAYEKGPTSDCPPERSQCVMQLNRQALVFYEAAGKEDPKYLYARRGLGYASLDRANIAMQTGDPNAQAYLDQAEKEFKEARTIDPTDYSTSTGLALADKKLGISEALKELNVENAITAENTSRIPSYEFEQLIRVPPITGKSRIVALKILSDAGFVPVTRGDGEFVTGQSPKPDSRLRRGSKVIVQFGPAAIRVFKKPNLP